MADRTVTVLFKTIYDGSGTSQALGGLDKVAKAGGGAEKSMKSFGASMTAVAATIYTARAALSALETGLKAATDIAKLGANTMQLRESFDTLNTAMGVTPSLLADIKSELKGTVSETDIMASYLTLVAGASENLTQKLAGAAPQLARIAKAATVLNPTLGDTTFMFDSLGRGIKRAEIRILDNLGLNIKVGQANEAYARSIGKTVEELTAEERQIALLNETLRVGEQLIKQAGNSTDAYADSISRVETQMKEARIAFSEGFAGEVLKGMDTLGESTGGVEAQMRALGVSLGIVAGEAVKFLDVIAVRAAKMDAFQTLTDTVDSMFMGKVGVMRSFALNEALDYDSNGVKRSAEDLLALTEIIRNMGESSAGVFWDFRNNSDDLARWLDDQLIQARREVAQRAAMESEAGIIELPIKITSDIGYDDLDGKLQNLMEGNEMFGQSLIMSTQAVNNQKRAMADQAAWDIYNEKVTAATEALAAFNAYLGQVFSEQVMGGPEDQFVSFKVRYATEGGLGEEEKELYEELQDAYTKSEEKIRSLERGAAGLGKTEEQLNKELEKQYGIMQQAADMMGQYEDRVATTSTEVGRGYEFNTKLMNESLFEAAQQAGASAEELARLGVALGLLSEEEAIAGLMATQTQVAIQKLGQDIERGVDTDIIVQQLEALPGRIANISWDVILNPDVKVEYGAATDDLAQKLFGDRTMGSEFGGDADTTVSVNANVDPATQALMMLDEEIAQAVMTAQLGLDSSLALTALDDFLATNAGRELDVVLSLVPPQAPANPRGERGRQGGYASGTSGFTVPDGYYDDDYMIGLTSGERVIVQRPGDTHNTYNLTTNFNGNTPPIPHEVTRSVLDGIRQLGGSV